VGRTIFADAGRAWLSGRMSDEEAVAQMADRYSALCRIWDEARAAGNKGEAA
jgi:5-dehydro-2-deoxygluconokinase